MSFCMPAEFSFLVYNDRGLGFICDLDRNASFDNLAILRGNIVTIYKKIYYKKNYSLVSYSQYNALQLTRHFLLLPSVVKSYAFIYFFYYTWEFMKSQII